MKRTAEIKNVYQSEQIGAIVYSIETSKIKPNASQPRTEFNISGITKLADSIRRYGLLQPLSVRKIDQARRFGEEYELVAGERRLRACKMLGMKTVPCIIIDAEPKKSAELALVENIMREDLNMFEEAKAFSALSTQYFLTQEEIAAKLSLSQSAVANKLRLLRLTQSEQELILSSGLTERHARALLRIQSPDTRKSALEYIICNKLNVSESEAYITSIVGGSGSAIKKNDPIIYTQDKLCNNIYKFITKIQKATDNRLTVNRRSDDKCIIFTLTVKKD